MEGTEQLTLREPVWGERADKSRYVKRWIEHEDHWASRVDRSADLLVEDDVATSTFDVMFRIRLFDEIKEISPGWEAEDWDGNIYKIERVARVGTVLVDSQRIGKTDIGCSLRKGYGGVIEVS